MMTSSDSSEDENSGSGSLSAYKGSWRPVNPEIWRGNREPGSARQRLMHRVRRVLDIFSSAEFLVFVAAPLGGLSIYLTFYLAYYLGGPGSFGVYFTALWAAVAVGAVLVLEKTGYARNFEGWDFPLRRIFVLPVAFFVVISLIMLVFYFGGAFH